MSLVCKMELVCGWSLLDTAFFYSLSQKLKLETKTSPSRGSEGSFMNHLGSPLLIGLLKIVAWTEECGLYWHFLFCGLLMTVFHCEVSLVALIFPLLWREIKLFLLNWYLPLAACLVLQLYSRLCHMSFRLPSLSAALAWVGCATCNIEPYSVETGPSSSCALQ